MKEAKDVVYEFKEFMICWVRTDVQFWNRLKYSVGVGFKSRGGVERERENSIGQNKWRKLLRANSQLQTCSGACISTSTDIWAGIHRSKVYKKMKTLYQLAQKEVWKSRSWRVLLHVTSEGSHCVVTLPSSKSGFLPSSQRASSKRERITWGRFSMD